MEEELLAVFFQMELFYQFTFWHTMDVSSNNIPPGSNMEETLLNSECDPNCVSETLVLWGKEMVLTIEIMAN